jgi:SAM-dependent methyltransferase
MIRGGQPARQGKRMVGRQALSAAAAAGRLAGRELRRTLRRVGFLRRGWYLTIELVRLLQDTPGRSRAYFEEEFSAHVDPWGFAGLSEQRRLRDAADMLDAVCSGARFRRALEIGCAEGAFTGLLADRCDSLLAVDVSSVALGRARSGRGWGDHVRFAQWDLRRDLVPGRFDLIVVMAVLEYFARPWALRAAREKLVAALNPGGYLFAGNTRHEPWEDSAWGRYLIRGGKWINPFIGEHPALRVVSAHTGQSYVHTLFRRVP